MSLTYQAVGWNRQKKIYDSLLAGGVAALPRPFRGSRNPDASERHGGNSAHPRPRNRGAAAAARDPLHRSACAGSTADSCRSFTTAATWA